MTRSRSLRSVALGLLGILGGTVLLVAFVVDIPSDLNAFRLVLFNIGAIAVVVGVHPYQAHVAPRLAVWVAGFAVAANAWYVGMEILSIGEPDPFGGEVGYVWFIAAIVMWLTDAAFGAVTLRLGVMGRWGAAALAIGSVLAITGIDRLGLTSSHDPTIFGPISLIGAALNGLGWILLGLDLALRGVGVGDDTPSMARTSISS